VQIFLSFEGDEDIYVMIACALDPVAGGVRLMHNELAVNAVSATVALGICINWLTNKVLQGCLMHPSADNA
jgi:hypothetical protein